MARQVDKSLVGSAGEHFVLYQLHRRGILAAAAPVRTPAVDLLVLSPDGESIVATVQVKTRLAAGRPSWPMNRKHETLANDRLFYAFVDLAQAPPVTWIVPSNVVAEVVREHHATWLATPGVGGRPHQDSPIRNIKDRYDCPAPGYPAGWMEPYRENWDLLLGLVNQ